MRQLDRYRGPGPWTPQKGIGVHADIAVEWPESEASSEILAVPCPLLLPHAALSPPPSSSAIPHTSRRLSSPADTSTSSPLPPATLQQQLTKPLCADLS
eukprot:CAMPEP_0181331654 /NCGR_PEP_ID=MMETSP1101-20121128/24629_1 /TAXON_ID=46948 /ORGANISM="Rhodomonas abbreviata, Strain Caron Lab Isolate" /LENGTH=98 /DNA_ID=CAMNT_0023441153 /DNA_START=26 /DNA_END=318 /DNA_ORIENTATION=-